MAIHFDVPEAIERLLQTQSGDANQGAKESALVKLYRRGLLSHGQLAETLDTSRAGVDVILNRHGVV